MLDIASDFYKNLFGFEPRTGFSLDFDFFSQKEKVSLDQNMCLEAPFLSKRSRRLSLTLIQIELQVQMTFHLCSIKKFGS
jgi:hypothetical protein